MPSANSPFNTSENDPENHPPRLRLTMTNSEEFRKQAATAGCH